MGWSAEGSKWISTSSWSGYGYYRCYLNVWVDSATSTDGQAKIRGTFTCQLYNTDGWGGSSYSVAGGKNYSSSDTGGVYASPYTANTWLDTNWSWYDIAIETVDKTKSSQTLSYEGYFSYGGSPSVKATASVNVPAKTSYTVSYDANGGTGAPTSQTKWYGENLTLSSTVPTRAGYTFLGWSTSSSATSATYSAGSTYSSNSAATLYAVWKIQAALITSIKDTNNQSTVTLGGSAVITWTPINNYTYKVKLEVGSKSTTSSSIAAGSTTVTRSMTIATFADQITDSTTGTATATLSTYDGNTLLGSDSKTFTVIVPNNSSTKPALDISNITFSDGNNAFLSTFGISGKSTSYISGLSSLKAVIAPTSSYPIYKYGASINSVSITVRKTNSSGAILSSKTYAGNNVISDTLNLNLATGVADDYIYYSVTVTDSRGFTSAAVTGTLSIYNYWSPGGSVTYDIVQNTTNHTHRMETKITWDISPLDDLNLCNIILTRIRGEESFTIVNKDVSNYSDSTSYRRGMFCLYPASGTQYIYEYIYSSAASNKTPSDNSVYWKKYGKKDPDNSQITLDTYNSGSEGYTWIQNYVEDANMSTYQYELVVEDLINKNIYTASTGVVCISRHRGGRGVTFFADASDTEISAGGLWANSIRLDLTTEEYIALATMIADTYSSTTVYSMGDFCTHTVSGNLYTFEYISTTSGSNHPPTNASYWERLN